MTSGTEATKLIKAGAVSIDGVKLTSFYYTRTGLPGPIEAAPLRLTGGEDRGDSVALAGLS